MKQLYFILLSLALFSCSENISELANDKNSVLLNKKKIKQEQLLIFVISQRLIQRC